MNIYRYTFNSVCPSDGKTITYRLEIRSTAKILAEDIRGACADGPQFQEDVADRLAALGGDQVIFATHQGVEIETRRP